ncbi:MAG: stage 0 sporulation family protein [Clostridia bacterium]|nr:stage 0 sporulation family protein [Clostridia bacterium]
MAKIIGVKFKDTAKVYYFSPANDKDSYPVNSGVIVDTARGAEYAKVVFDVREIKDEKLTHALKPVIRKATEKDEKNILENQKKIPETTKFAEEQIEKLGLEMKLIGCEYSFDGKKLVFYFTAEKRVDFRELVKIFASKFHTRIELRQVGIRDETKMLGGIAPCGRTCCCSGSISDFGKVTIKMAKNQGLHLNPSKISGLCGRLMCCLEYENDYYAEVYPKMPKVGGTVTTPEGTGTVVSNDMLKMICKVKVQKPDGGEVYKDFPVDKLQFKRNKPTDKDEKDEIISEDVQKILD